jgi:hypothetical protein
VLQNIQPSEKKASNDLNAVDKDQLEIKFQKDNCRSAINRASTLAQNIPRINL